ncbi:hypothetical protein [Chryseobacterium arthrosphaerae]|uniref:hypothetical protein n=1 Tax=Chryseobacterium arthrosphaerae TaxID=651561 RepID=UPI001E657B64|nr:hypothetical protein [Chryseobacterium arthrosphaerae]UEQ76532.1 hypothetical protein J8N07_23490 [Chryseobacterium arthrosphaerae]
MKYLPFERITYRTDWPEEKVIKTLNEFVDPKQFGFGKTYTKEYEGYVNRNSFEISRTINYRNSFLPQINGTVHTISNGTQIDVTMKLNVFVLFFLIIWCSVASLFFVGMCGMMIRDHQISIISLMPLLMLLFVYILTMAGFKAESRKSKEFLRKSFEAEVLKD